VDLLAVGHQGVTSQRVVVFPAGLRTDTPYHAVDSAQAGTVALPPEHAFVCYTTPCTATSKPRFKAWPRGARKVPGVEGVIKRVPETLDPETFKAADGEADQQALVSSLSELADYDGIIFGTHSLRQHEWPDAFLPGSDRWLVGERRFCRQSDQRIHVDGHRRWAGNDIIST